MIGLAASIAIVVFLVCIVFIVYALRSRAARSHISILSLIILLLIGSSLGVYASVGRFSDWERAQVDNTKDHRLAAKITQARRVAMNKPRSVEARRDLAGLYMQGGLFGESAKTLDEALTITGPNAGLYGDKARALYYRDHRQMTPEVKLTLEKALSLNPTEASSRMLLGYSGGTCLRNTPLGIKTTQRRSVNGKQSLKRTVLRSAKRQSSVRLLTLGRS